MKYSLFLLVAFFAIANGHCEIEPCLSNIHFSPHLIQLVTTPLPVFELGDAVVAPRHFLNNIIKNVIPDCELKECEEDSEREECENSDTLTAYDKDKLIAFVDPKTGESNVFPLFESLTPGEGLSDKARKIADHLVYDESLFPKHESEQVVAHTPVILSRSKSASAGNATSPEDTLAYVTLRRQINGYPVIGPGTQAMIAVAADGSVHALTHRWRRASHSHKSIEPHHRQRVAHSILHQLSALAKRSESITIDKVTVIYYDGGREFLQPAYRFEGTIASIHHQINIGLVGYVSIGDAVEPLPVLNLEQDVLPTDPHSTRRRRRDARDKKLASRTTDITVGRYVVRNDSNCWVESANSFWDGLVQGESSPGSGLTFINNQYYWAHPFQYTSLKNIRVNSVQIALTEAHGDWWEYSTYENSGNVDEVKLSDIVTAGGFGANAGGSLAYWIIHSCEVIPTQTDESTSFDIWWGIFRGMHSVMGYRTQMTICDGVTSGFGKAVGMGAPVVSAWFQAILNNAAYSSPNDIKYNDTNRNIIEPRGRASSVSVCGHVDDTAHNVEGLPNPTQLCEIWLNN